MQLKYQHNSICIFLNVNDVYFWCRLVTGNAMASVSTADSGSILNMSGSTFIQSVGVMDRKELFDEQLQVTGCTHPTYQSGSNSFSLINVIRLLVMSWNPTGALAFRFDNNPLPSSCQSALLTLSTLNVKYDTCSVFSFLLLNNKKIWAKGAARCLARNKLQLYFICWLGAGFQ